MMVIRQVAPDALLQLLSSDIGNTQQRVGEHIRGNHAR